MTDRIGIDLGGTKIAGVRVSLGGIVVQTDLTESPQGSYAATLEAVAAMAGRLGAGSAASVGISAPGSVLVRDGDVPTWKGSNCLWINGQPLAHDLSRRIGRPVRMENDASCFTLAEALTGAGVGARVVFGITLGTGVGGGLVSDGRLWTGPSGTAGEWGHTPLPWQRASETPGPPCYCGHEGCVETWVSGRALERDWLERTGTSLKATEVARRDPNDPIARALMDDYIDRLGRALSTIVNVLDPDVIVVGGGLSGIGRLYRDLPAIVQSHAFGGAFRGDIRPPAHGWIAGAVGAAMLKNDLDEGASQPAS